MVLIHLGFLDSRPFVMISDFDRLVGESYTFEDGDKIEVIQIKHRSEDEVLIHFKVYQGPGIPRKLVLHSREFLDSYGHLFNLE